MTVAGNPGLRPADWPRRALIALCAAMALLCALALVRVPTRDATILAFVVGGVHAVAAYLLIRRNRHGAELAAIAGALLGGWILTEAIVLRSFTVAQFLPLTFAVITTGLALHLAARRLEAPRWRHIGSRR